MFKFDRAVNFCLFVVISSVGACFGEIQVFDLGRVKVQGSWSDVGGEFVTDADRQRFDLNQDGNSDLEFTHNYSALTPGGVPIPVAGALSAVRPALEVTRIELQRIYQLNLDAANTGVNDADLILQIQTEIHNSFDTIRRTHDLARWDDRELLSGDFGIWQVSTSEIGRVVDAGLSARAAPFQVDIVSPAERAWFTSEPIPGRLTEEAHLSVNGVFISFLAGTDLSGIVRRINDFSSRAGAIAHETDQSEFRLLSSTFGSEARLRVESTDIIGITGTDYGVDAELRFSTGEGYEGNGMFIHRSDGVVAQLNPGDDRRLTASGDLRIDLNDGSLQFPFGKERQDAVVTIPNLDFHERSFVGSNGFSAFLYDLDVTAGEDVIQRFLGPIESAIDESDQLLRNVDRILSEPVLPAGKLQSFSLNRTRLIGDAMASALEPGDLIGPASSWSGTGVLDIAGVELDTWNVDSRLFGVELSVDGEAFYGWIEVGLTEDSGLELIQAAFETQPGVPIRAGLVPEADSLGPMLLAILCVIASRRKH